MKTPPDNTAGYTYPLTTTGDAVGTGVNPVVDYSKLFTPRLADKSNIDRFLELAALKNKDQVLEKLEQLLITQTGMGEEFRIIVASLILLLKHDGGDNGRTTEGKAEGG